MKRQTVTETQREVFWLNFRAIRAKFKGASAEDVARQKPFYRMPLHAQILVASGLMQQLSAS
jgi:hypothetical protein